MKIPYYQVNAFTGAGFKGNPAGVCLNESWLSDIKMQEIATENNLSETAFIVKAENYFNIRWFTPSTEVDLCGHATLASAYIIFEYIEKKITEIQFMSKSGKLSVEKTDSLLMMNFPADKLKQISLPKIIIDSLQIEPLEIYKGKTDYMAVFENELQIRTCKPDLNILGKLDGRGLIITAKGDNTDFVSRFFAPQSGIPEDPVTGSAHTTLVPYWSEKLGKIKLSAYQLSERGGEIFCTNFGERIGISGKAEIYIEGYIHI
jgi:PhzF family phenazine biosynthesis protein